MNIVENVKNKLDMDSEKMELLTTICSCILDEHSRLTGGQIRAMLYDALDLV